VWEKAALHGAAFFIVGNNCCLYAGTTTYERIISLSSCSSKWQCQTYFPAKPSNLTIMRVTVMGSTRTVSFHPISPGASSVGGPVNTFFVNR